jgi:hypothetical protein
MYLGKGTAVPAFVLRSTSGDASGHADAAAHDDDDFPFAFLPTGCGSISDPPAIPHLGTSRPSRLIDLAIKASRHPVGRSLTPPALVPTTGRLQWRVVVVVVEIDISSSTGVVGVNPPDAARGRSHAIRR